MMPIKVPVLEQQVGLAPLPGQRQHSRPLAAEAGQSLARAAEDVGRLGQQVGGLIQKVKHDQDNAAGNEAYVNLSKARQEWLNSTGTEQWTEEDPATGELVTRTARAQGLLQMRGKKALQERQSVVDSYDKLAQRLRKDLANDEQRAIFDQMLAQDRAQFVATVDNHVAKESDTILRETTNAALAAAVTDGINGVTQINSILGTPDIGPAEISKKKITKILKDFGESQGWSKAQIDDQIRKQHTIMHLGIIDMLVEQDDPIEAQEYLEVMQSAMDGAMLSKSNVFQTVNAAVAREGARDIANQAWEDSKPIKAVSGVDPEAEGAEVIKGEPSLAAAIEIIRGKGLSRDQEDEAIAVVRRNEAIRVEAVRMDDAPKLARLEEKIRTGQGFSLLDRDYTKLSDGEKGDGKVRALRMRDAFRRSQRAARNEEKRLQFEIDRNFDAWYTRLDLVGNPGNDKLTVDLNDPRHDDVSVWKRDNAIGLQKDLNRKIDAKASVSATEFQRQIVAILADEGITGTRAEEIIRHQNGQYMNYVNDPRNAGIPPPQSRVDEWFAGYRIHGERARREGFWQPNMTAGEAASKGWAFKPDDGEVIPAPDIGKPAPKIARESEHVIVMGGKRYQKNPGEVFLINYSANKVNIGPASGADAWLADHPGWERYTGRAP
jgi:hypothetical protein